MLSALAGLGFPRLRAQLMVPFNTAAATGVGTTDIPAAAAYFGVTPRHMALYNLSAFTECRLVVHLGSAAGNAGSFLRMGYALSYPSAAADLLQIGASGQVQVALDQTVSRIYSSSWVPLAAAARADVILGLVTVGGDGVADPLIYHVLGQFR